MYYAHSENANGDGCRENLVDHLTRVAKRAARYASAFDAEKQATVAGLLHDIGKYADQFQRRLDPRYSEPGRDHSSQGAALAACCYGDFGLLPALTIEGHHAGLRMLKGWKSLAREISSRFQSHPDTFTDPNVERLMGRFQADGLSFPELTDGLTSSEKFAAADMLDVRMLFSTLVDADFIETEAHFAGNATQPRQCRSDGPGLDPSRAFAVVKKKIDALTRSSVAEDRVRRVRSLLGKSCIDAATSHAPGAFTLSAPTGSGKTLAMLAFALRHAMQHKLRRVIVVMPYLSIIEQTAAIYCKLFSPANGFPPSFVIEGGSNPSSSVCVTPS